MELLMNGLFGFILHATSSAAFLTLPSGLRELPIAFPSMQWRQLNLQDPTGVAPM